MLLEDLSKINSKKKNASKLYEKQKSYILYKYVKFWDLDPFRIKKQASVHNLPSFFPHRKHAYNTQVYKMTQSFL